MLLLLLCNPVSYVPKYHIALPVQILMDIWYPIFYSNVVV